MLGRAAGPPWRAAALTDGRTRSMMSGRVHLALLAHGSRNPRWPDGLRPMVDALQAELGGDAVALCFLELIAPSLPELAARVAADGFEEMRVLPLFWSGQGHVLRDVPVLVEQAVAAAPGLRISLLPAVGEQPLVQAAIAELARAGLRANADVEVAEAAEAAEPVAEAQR